MHFQVHAFEKRKLYILHEEINLNNTLNLENLYICNLQTLFPFGLSSKLNGEGPYDLNNCYMYNKFFEAWIGFRASQLHSEKILVQERYLMKTP